MSSDTSSEKDQSGFVKECQDANKPSKSVISDEGSCDKSGFSRLSSQTNNKNCGLKEFPHLAIDGDAGTASIVTSSTYLQGFIAEKLVDGNSHFKVENVTSTVNLDSSDYPKHSNFKLHGDTSKGKDELHKFEKVPIGSGIDMCNFEDPLDVNPPALISLGGNAKLSGYNDRIPCSLLSKSRDNVPVVSRDDDENSYGCTHPINTKTKSFRLKTGIGDNRISKRLASNFQKVAEKTKDHTHSNNGESILMI